MGKKSSPPPSSIIQRITGLVLGAIVLQTALLSGLLVVGGVVQQARETAFRGFHDKVEGRKDALQNQMKSPWTNFAPSVADLRQDWTQAQGHERRFFDLALADLVPMLRTTQATGVFVILTSGPATDAPALYLRDYDPTMNAFSDDDLYLVYGPPEVAKAANIPMDQTWRERYQPGDGSQDFLRRPLELAARSVGPTNLGYWSRPFRLSPGDIDILTYTVPFQDPAGKVLGVVGVEISVNYLTRFLPAQEIQPQDSLGYLIAFRDDPTGPLVPVVQGGALQKRFIAGDRPLGLAAVEGSTSLREVVGHLGHETVFADVERLGLYQYRTPFEREQWYLVGLARGSSLLASEDRIRQTLMVSLVAAIVIGTFAGAWIAYQVTRPIASLARQVRDGAQHWALDLAPTGLAELDDLSQSIVVANRRMLESASRLTKIVEMLELPLGAFEVDLDLDRVFVTDHFWSIVGVPDRTAPMTQDEFWAALAPRLAQPEPNETNVYRLDDPVRWIRYKESRNEGSLVGVVLDVTGEIHEKRQMQNERDTDPLTGLWNRQGFQREFDRWWPTRTGVSALVMFDLDNLKGVNDTHGHRAGDLYIVTAVEHLTVAAGDGVLGRRSGDEFVLLLRGFDDQGALRARLDGLFARLAASPLVWPDGSTAPVSLSAGLVWIDDPGWSYDELLHFADEALYVAKRQSKGTLVESVSRV